MKFLSPPVLLLGLGAAAWFYTKNRKPEGTVMFFPEDFDPSEYEYNEEEMLALEEEYGDYGVFGLSKSERRDRKRRQAARKMKRYEKCVAKKGEEKCAKKLSRAERKLLKAQGLDDKLAAKGKITQVAFDSSGQIQTSSGGIWSAPTAATLIGAQAAPKFVPSTAAIYAEDDLYMDDEGADISGPSPILLGVGGLAVVGVVGFVLFSLTKPKKKAA